MITSTLIALIVWFRDSGMPDRVSCIFFVKGESCERSEWICLIACKQLSQ